MIPAVRTWKVTNKVTGRSIEVMTINKRFARMIASDFGMWGQPCTVSLVKPKPAPMIMNMDSQGFRRWWKAPVTPRDLMSI